MKAFSTVEKFRYYFMLGMLVDGTSYLFPKKIVYSFKRGLNKAIF